MKKFVSLRCIAYFLMFVMSFCIIDYAYGSTLNNPDNKPYWGVRASFNIVSPRSVYIMDTRYNVGDYYDLFHRGIGGSLGGIFHLPIVANFYFEPGLSFNYGKFGIQKDALIGTNKELLETDGVLKQSSVSFTSIKLPLVLGYHFDFSKDFNLSLFMGPVINYAFSMNAKIKIDTNSSVVKTEASLFKPYKSENDDYLKQFYGQWRLGTAFNYKQFMIGFTFDGDISNLFRVSDYNKQFYIGHFSLLDLSFNIGYNFK